MVGASRARKLAVLVVAVVCGVAVACADILQFVRLPGWTHGHLRSLDATPASVNLQQISSHEGLRTSSFACSRQFGPANFGICLGLGLALCRQLQRGRLAARAARAAEALQEALGAEVPGRAGATGQKLRPLVVAMGTRGDAEPGFRLAAALQARGHVPLVVSLDAYKTEAVDRWCLDFRSCGIDRVPMSEEYLTGQTRADQVYADRGWYGDAWVGVGQSIYAAAVEHKCDFIVTTSMGNTHSLDVAEKLGLLCFALKFCPDIDGQVPTGEFPPSGYPAGMPGPLNVLAHSLENLRTVGAVFIGGFIPRVIAFRKELGFPSQKISEDIEVPTYSPYRQQLQANQPCLYAFSSALVDRPPEYRSWHFITGSLSHGESVEKSTPALPAALSQFLQKEPNQERRGPVCIAFGSMSLARSAPFQERAVAAARRLGLRVVLVDPDAKQEGQLSSDEEVFCTRSVPYSALFPKCCLVVHHGGAGTLQDCLFAGTPQVIAPVLRWSDQPFWASVLESRALGMALGDGGEAPAAGDWDATLASALSRLEEFSAAARAVSANVASEDGTESACDVLEGALLT